MIVQGGAGETKHPHGGQNAADIGFCRASCYGDRMTWRVKSEIYIQALVRRVYAAQAAAYVVRRGDSDAGGMLIRINRLDGCSGILTMFTDMQGERGWRVSLAASTPDQDVEAFLEREVARDPDVWIVEIEDTEGRRFLEEKIDGAWE